MKIFNYKINILLILFYIISMIILGLIYKYSFYIMEFILLPSPLLSYRVLKIFSFAIKNNLLKTLLKMREEVEKQIYNIDLIPIILCIGHKPFNVNMYTFSNEYLTYTITSKNVLLHIMPEYYIHAIKILESIWNGKPFHSVVVNVSITNMKRSLPDIVNTLNKIYKLTNIQAPLFIYFDFDVENNTFNNINIDNEIGFKIDTNSITNLYDVWNEFINNLLNIILINKNMGYYDVINYLQNNTKEIIDFIFSVSNSDFKLFNVFFYNSLNTNINSLNYTINNIITSKSSSTKFIKHSIYSRINKFILLLIGIIVSLCGIITYRHINSKLIFYNDVYEVTNSLKINKTTLSNVNSNNSAQYNFLSNAHSILINKPNLIMKTVMPLDNIKKLRQVIFQNLQIHLTNIDINIEKSEFTNNPTYTPNFIKLKNVLENRIEIYEQIYNINKIQSIKNLDIYTQSLQNNIIYIHDQWLKSLNEFTLIKKSNNLYKSLNEIYKNAGSIQDYKLFLQQCNEIQALFSYTYNDWWIKNKFSNNYHNLINDIKTLPHIGEELSIILLNKKEIALNSIHNNFMHTSHPLLQNNNVFNIYESNGKFIVSFSDQMKQFIFTIENILKDELLCLDDSSVSIPVLNDNQYFIWNDATIQKVLAYKAKYFAFTNKLNNYNNAIAQSFIQICNDRLYRYIYRVLIQDGNTVSIAYPTTKVSININNNYLALKEISQFIQVNLNKNINYINNLHKHNINIIYNQVKKIIKKSILFNYQFINDWNGNNDIIQVLFAKSSSQLPDIVENMILNFKEINSDIIENILNASYEQTTNEFAYFKYLNNTIKGYENGTRNDLGKAKEFILSLSNINMKSQTIPASDIDTTHDIAFYTQIFKTSVQSRINEIILQRSRQLFNELVEYYNDNLKDCAPFTLNSSPAKIEHIITFVNKYKLIRQYLMEDVELFNKYITIKKDIEFLDNIVSFFIIENNNVSVNIDISENNEEYKETAVNTNLILKYIHQFGLVTQEDELSIRYKYNITDNYNFTLRIANTSAMEVAPYISDPHITTKSNKLTIKYSNLYGFFNFVNKVMIARTGKYQENVVLRIPVNIVSFNNDVDINEKDVIVTYLLLKNWPNIHNYELSLL